MESTEDENIEITEQNVDIAIKKLFYHPNMNLLA